MTVGKKGWLVEADPKRSCSSYGSGVPRKMKGAGEEGEAKKGSSMNDWTVVISGSGLVLGCSANMLDLTLGTRPSGRSSGPGIKDSQSLLGSASCQFFL